MRCPCVVFSALVLLWSATPPHAGVTRWVPPVATTWQWQLTGRVDTSVDAAVFDVDLFDSSAATVATLHGMGRHAVCYVSAGTFEDWRPDASRFPAQVLGNAVDGWQGERWLDIRRLDVLAPIMIDRVDLCRSKGFDAVEPDNVDGYTNKSGFPLTAADQLAYNRWIADAAHARGLSVALKNDLDQAAELVASFDWALDEQCFQYRECDLLSPFTAAGKAVFEVEYQMATSDFCPQAVTRRFDAMRKNPDLDAYRDPCPTPLPAPPKNLRIIR